MPQEDNTAVNEEVVSQESTTTESATVENKNTEVADPILDSLSDDDDSPVLEKPTPEETKEVVAEEEEKADDTASEPEAEKEQPQGKAEERKQQLNSEIRDLVAQKKQLREEVESMNAKVYQPQTAEELVAEGYSEEVAEVKSLKQELELQNYNNRVYEAQISLGEQAGQVISSFPIFNPDSPDFQPDIAASAAEALEASLMKDPNTGQIIGSHVTPYQIYKPIADAYEKSQIAGRIQGQKSTEKMLASVDAPTSVTPKEPKKDLISEILSSDD